MAAGAQPERAVLAGIAHRQLLRFEAVAVVAGAPAHLVEHQVPAFFRQPSTPKIDAAIDFRRAAPAAQRQVQREGGGGRPGSLQVVEGFGVLGMQGTVPQQFEQRGGIAAAVGAHLQRRTPEVGDAGLQPLHGNAIEIALSLHGETVADEGDLAQHRLHGRPAFLEADAPVADRGGGFEAAVAFHERPIVQVAGHQAAAAGDGAAFQRHVQPVHRGPGHLVVDPELLRHRHLGIGDVGGDPDPGPGAVALEPQAATRIDGIVAAVHPQRRGAYLPALSLAPGLQVAVEPQPVDHAEAAGPVEAQRAARVQRQLHAVGVAFEAAGQAIDARRVADRCERDPLDPPLHAQRPSAQRGHFDLRQRGLRRGVRHPLTQRWRQPVAQGGNGQQGRRVDPVGLQGDAASTGDEQSVQRLRPARVGHAQQRCVQAPAVRGDPPARQAAQLVQAHLRQQPVGQRRAGQQQVPQLELRGHQHHAMVPHLGPGLDLSASVDGRDPGVVQQGRPAAQRPGLQVEGTAATAAVAVELECQRRRRRVRADPGARAGIDLAPVHAQAQVDLRDARAQSQRRCAHVQLAADHLQLAQALEVVEWIGGTGHRQAAHRPAPVVGALQGERGTAQPQLGERAPRQQAGVHRHQHLGLADAHASAGIADVQAFKLQQRSAAGPLRVDAIEADRPPGLLAEPGGDALGMALGQWQHLAGRAQHQRHQHQHHGQQVGGPAAGQAQAAADGGGHQRAARARGHACAGHAASHRACGGAIVSLRVSNPWLR